MANTCRILKKRAALFGTQAQRSIYQSLPNNGIRIVTNARLRQQDQQVAQAHFGIIDEIFILA